MIKAGKYTLNTNRTLIMGILNITPDSFSDGGRYGSVDSAVSAAYDMKEQGADIIDIGGQSTRPGADTVPLDEERNRVMPVLEALCGGVGIPVSIDTFYADIASEALKMGTGIINTVRGLEDGEMFRLAAKYGAGIVIMHNTAGSTGGVRVWLENMIKSAENSGVDSQSVITDIGIGFGKTFKEDLALLRELKNVIIPPYPMLVGASRKRVIGGACGNPPPQERDFGTAAAHTAAIMNGAKILRVHNVAAAVQAARVAESINIVD